jgi:hypothetical protein
MSEAFKSLRAVVGKSIVIAFSREGKVLEIRGMKEMMAETFKDMPPQVLQMFEQSFGEDKLKEMWQCGFPSLPERPVRIGEEWENKIELKIPMLGGPISIGTRFKLEELAREGVARISTVMEYSMGDGGDMQLPWMPEGSKVSFKMEGKPSAGEMRFDAPSGRMLRFATPMDARISMEASGVDPEGQEHQMKMKMDMKGATVMELVR